jgi:hypothetical protein
MTRTARQLDLTFHPEIASNSADRFAALFAVPLECDTTARTLRKPRRRRKVGMSGRKYQPTLRIVSTGRAQ